MCNSEMACRAITLCAPPIAVQAVRYGSKAVDHERLLLAKSRWSRTAAVGQKEPVGCLQEIRGDSDELKAFQSKFSDYVKW